MPGLSKKTCPACQGDGNLQFCGGTDCPTCEGKGKVDRSYVHPTTALDKTKIASTLHKFRIDKASELADSILQETYKGHGIPRYQAEVAAQTIKALLEENRKLQMSLAENKLKKHWDTCLSNLSQDQKDQVKVALELFLKTLE